MDKGFTHIALEVKDVEKTMEFYELYAGFSCVHFRETKDKKEQVAWLADGLRNFVFVVCRNFLEDY